MLFMVHRITYVFSLKDCAGIKQNEKEEEQEELRKELIECLKILEAELGPEASLSSGERPWGWRAWFWFHTYMKPWGDSASRLSVQYR